MVYNNGIKKGRKKNSVRKKIGILIDNMSNVISLYKTKKHDIDVNLN